MAEGVGGSPRGIGIRQITLHDLVDVVGAGIADFRAAPTFGLFFAGLYVGAGWLILALLWHFSMPYLAYPLAMGFALIAPFAAVGFYAVSSFLQAGRPLTWAGVLGALREAAGRDIRWMALVTGFALVIWMDIAAFLFFGFMGFQALDAGFIQLLFTTPAGIVFLVIGNLGGAVIAVLVFSITAVSFPMLYDRDVDFVTAMMTSVRLVIENPRTMLVWCLIIGILLGLSVLSAFVGFLVTLPVIGHATWHLYRRAIEPAATAAPVVVAELR